MIDHPNYNPRLIEHVVSLARSVSAEPDLVDLFHATLENPDRLWEHAVQNQLTDLQRAVLFAMASLPTEVRLHELLMATRPFVQMRPAFNPDSELKETLKVLEDTFVTVGRVRSAPTVRFHNPSIRDFLLSAMDAETSVLARLVEYAVFFEQIELLWSYGTVGTGWRDSEVRRYDGVDAWFRDNPRTVIDRMIELFASPFGAYRQSSDPNGRKDLVPTGTLERRVAQVLRFAEQHDIQVNDWLAVALGQLERGWSLHRGDRSDWLTVLHAAGSSAHQAVIIANAEPSQEWFFSDLSTADEFFAYQRIAESCPWWLPEDHEEQAREHFEWFVESELDWITHSADEAGNAAQSLEELQVLAEEFSITLKAQEVQGAEEAIWQLPNPDDLPDMERGGPPTRSAVSPTEDINGLFDSLNDWRA